MTTDWTAGYVADIGYTFGYYGELNPLYAQLAFLSAGLVPPQVGTACELGFGQGISINAHAAASVTQWHGTDFNPSQAAYAQEMAGKVGAGVQLYDEAFADFAQRDLPDFDYIGLHGIWSWISDENRAVIVDFIRRKLKVGGVVYISYNTLPGWSKFGPLRQLFSQHAKLLGAQGVGTVQRVNEGMAFAESLLATNPAWARANAGAVESLGRFKKQNPQYLAHEFFNSHWDPMYFADVNEWLSDAKLTFACSATYFDHVDALNMTPEQQQYLAAIPDANLRQSARDFMVNQQFRRDYWVKGPRKLTRVEQMETIRDQRVVLLVPRADVRLTVQASLGEATLAQHIYGPVLDVLADCRVHTVAEIEQAVQAKDVGFTHVLQVLMVMIGSGQMAAVQKDHVIAQARERTDRFNRIVLDKARGSDDLLTLASPVTGGGFNLPRMHQLFLGARVAGKTTRDEWIRHAWSVLSLQGQRLRKEGVTLETEEQNLAELELQLVQFERRLPIIETLQIA